jgi:hypothetical protein
VSEPPAPDGPPGDLRTDPGPAASAPAGDASSGDRRTLVIGAVTMVALVAIGVVSGSLFAGSACRGLAPTALPPVASSDLDTVVAAAFPEVGTETTEELVESITELAGSLGPMAGVVAAPGAERLAVVDGGIGIVGTTTTIVADGTGVTSAGFDATTTVLGGGGSLYALALTNPLTGQVDALQPVDLGLAPGTCVDTAVVGSPLAFVLDAGGGQLALLRVGEDGGDAELELRDPVAGRVWAAPLEVPPAPAGVLGEWSTGAIGDDLVVVAQRTRPAGEEPVVLAVERRSGTTRWELDRAVLGLAADTAARQVTVLHADRDVVVVAFTPAADGPGSDEPGAGGLGLAAYDAADGALVWAHELPGAATVADLVVEGQRAWAAVPVAGGTDVVYLDAGAATVVRRVDGRDVHLGRLEGERLLVASEDGVAIEGAAPVGAPFVVRDVLASRERVVLLLEGPDDGAVAVTFGP